jgi:hypothetical protein
VPVKLVFVRYVDEIIKDLLLAGIFSSPVGVGFEGQRIKVAPNVL